MAGAYDLLVTQLVGHLGVPAARLSPEVTFTELRLDSLAMVELALVMKEEYGIRIQDLPGDLTLAGAGAELDRLRAESTAIARADTDPGGST
ncbi:phosphopantetheine-binding protein [Kitasatospora sp. GP82]|uniref:acyl carrier protein n=1 Tax=Kitasatospora sp. GP82 TaxID=3035089 RepID=UPI002473CF1E|nr:phosphopantetheine-binding protein [Kitasatospora sp. GP82]MDH6129716.1 acyl carrier protein [Kitasatospora sp. GP82]